MENEPKIEPATEEELNYELKKGEVRRAVYNISNLTEQLLDYHDEDDPQLIKETIEGISAKTLDLKKLLDEFHEFLKAKRKQK